VRAGKGDVEAIADGGCDEALDDVFHHDTVEGTALHGHTVGYSAMGGQYRFISPMMFDYPTLNIRKKGE
jgi:hypothetical protein